MFDVFIKSGFIFSHHHKDRAAAPGARQNYHHSLHIQAETWSHLNVSDDVHKYFNKSSSMFSKDLGKKSHQRRDWKISN